jgi:hypothetical protein
VSSQVKKGLSLFSHLLLFVDVNINSVERRASAIWQLKTHQRTSYNANLKIAVVKYADDQGNHLAAEKCLT